MVLASLPPELSQHVSSQSLCPGYWGRAGHSLGGSPGPKPQVSGGIGVGGPEYHFGAELASFLGLCSCLLGSQGMFALASQGMGPPCWQGSHPASWVCLSRKCQEGSERSYETPRGRASFPKPTTSELRGSGGCPVHASACSFLNCSGQRNETSSASSHSMSPLPVPYSWIHPHYLWEVLWNLYRS